MRMFLLTGLVVMCAMTVEGITGFGATIFALPFLTMLMSVKSAVPFLAMFSLCFGVYIMCTCFKKIDRMVLKTVLIFAGLGMPIGLGAMSYFPERVLKLILGFFVTAFAVKSLWAFVSGHGAKAVGGKLHEIAERIALFLGGIFHGAFASGGPLIVFYVSGRIKDKAAFRATMTSVWVVFNVVIIVKNILSGGVYNASFMTHWLSCVPFFALGAFLGNRLHKRVSVRMFSLISNVLLLVAGLSTLITQLLS